MKLKRIITIFVAAVLYTATASAQRVINEDGKIMIDASGIANASSATLNNPTLPVPDRALIYKKFEVAKADVLPGKWIEVFLNEAIPACHNMGKGNSEWRLPTYRELMLMMMLKSELAKNGIILAEAKHWSITTVNNYNSFHFGEGLPWRLGFQNPARGRCIREIKPLPASK